mmetsp:Transcript_2583/g.10827  ORF Transcript_2583/g.10827 Transcript_2583/m.10827 type:complete len:260 (-) Transcript_2583:1-780(-)
MVAACVWWARNRAIRSDTITSFCARRLGSFPKDGLQLAEGVLRIPHRVPYRPRMHEDLVVVATFVCLVPEEVHLVEVLLVHEAKAVRLVPSRREDVEGDLAADAVREVVLALELGSHRLDHGLANLVHIVIRLKVVPLLARAIPTDGTDVEHSSAELDERAALDRAVNLAHVPHDPVDDVLDGRLPEMLGNRRLGQQLPSFVGHEAVLAEAKVKILQHGVAKLLLLLHKVRAANDTDGDLHQSPDNDAVSPEQNEAVSP